MNWKHQTKYFINGVILVVFALYCITFLPFFIRSKIGLTVPSYVYYQVEFFLLSAAAIFFLFSPKYYKNQILVILLGVLYYILFAKYY